MAFYILRRLGQTAVTAVFVSMIVFSLARVTGDPTILLLPTEATQEDRDFFRKQLGLDQPLHLQYADLRGQRAGGRHGPVVPLPRIGTGHRARPPAGDACNWRRSPCFSPPFIALPIGILAAIRRDTWVDTVGTLVRHPRPGHANILAWHDPDPVLLGPSRLAAHIRARRRGEPDSPGNHPGLVLGRRHRPAHPLLHAGGDAKRLRALRAPVRPARARSWC